MKQKISAVIPIREGSQRVKDKNLRKFANTTLLELKIDTLKSVGLFDEIIVNTDSESAINIAIKKGIKYHRREAFYASSKCSGSEFFEHLGRVTNTDIFAYCPVTSPFITIETIKKCITTFLETSEHDSLVTVSSVKEFLWLNGKPINYSVKNAPNSQDLPNIVSINFGIALINKAILIENKNIIGNNPQFITTDDIESIDIDTPLDFYLAEKIYKKLIVKRKNLLD